ncbi:MAG: hypothetical protein U0795_04555 [Pirellulales bacterium]
MRYFLTTLTVAVGIFGLISQTPAATIVSGSAKITLTEGLANSVNKLDAYFDATATRSQTLTDPAPGNLPFISTPPSTVQLNDPIRPSGEVPAGYPGTPGSSRSPQLTTLDLDPDNILGSWTPSNDAVVFVGNTTLGEQIAFTSMQRWTGPFPGVLLYGDFALRYVPGRANANLSGLVLTSNIDFLGAAFADIANASITVSDDNTLSITGDLWMAGGLTALDPSAVTGTNFGDFELSAKLVPEPGSAGLILLGGTICWLRSSRTRRASRLATS